MLAHAAMCQMRKDVCHADSDISKTYDMLKNHTFIYFLLKLNFRFQKNLSNTKTQAQPDLASQTYGGNTHVVLNSCIF